MTSASVWGTCPTWTRRTTTSTTCPTIPTDNTRKWLAKQFIITEGLKESLLFYMSPKLLPSLPITAIRRGNVQFWNSLFQIKGSWSVHSFNDDYLSIPEGTGSCGYLFMKSLVYKKLLWIKSKHQDEMDDFGIKW